MPITCQAAGLAAALGLGLAVAAGCGIANAESSDSGQSQESSGAARQSHESRAPGIKAGKIAASRAAVAGTGISAPTPVQDSDDAPSAPSGVPAEVLTPLAGRKLSGVSSIRTITPPARVVEPVVTPPDSSEVEAGSPSDAEADLDDTPPSPSDMTETIYGDIGDWMLQANGQIADWIGQKEDGRTLLEPVNVIIIDPTTAPLDKAVMRLNRAMTMAGFPGVIFHSGHYQGLINGDEYQQQPVGAMLGYSDAFFLLPNNHGRIFGPYVMPGGGYMWTAALSREELGEYDEKLTHVFVSFNEARDALRSALIERTGAIDLGDVLMDTVYHSDTITTGDSDGHTAVIQLSL